MVAEKPASFREGQWDLRVNLGPHGSFNQLREKGVTRSLPHVAVKWFPELRFALCADKSVLDKRLPLGERFRRTIKTKHLEPMVVFFFFEETTCPTVFAVMRFCVH